MLEGRYLIFLSSIPILLIHDLRTLDVVFVVYLYQMWIYPIDKGRPNEFGQSFEGEKVEELSTNKSALSPDTNFVGDESSMDRNSLRGQWNLRQRKSKTSAQN